MAYGTKYIINATNLLNEDYEIKFDYLNYSDFVTELTATNDFLNLRSTNGDEDRLASILGTEAIIKIDVSETDQITIADLIAMHDSDIKVTITRIEQATGDRFISFQGFVVVEDNNQPFLDPPFILSVRALDGLGLLKDVPLTDLNDLLFTGSMTIIQWIGQILYKTNQDVPVRVYFNFFPLNFVETSAFAEITLNAITFKQGTSFNSTPNDPSTNINLSAADDCYTALEKIMRCFRCRLFFEDGRFMIVNIQEYANPNYNFQEYVFGTIVNGIVPMNPIATGIKKYNVSIGKQEIIFPVESDQILYLKLATKFVKLTYNYDQSLNKICNQDLTEGDRNVTYDEVISSSIIDSTITPVVNLDTHGYDLYCYDHFNGNGPANFWHPYPTNAPDKKAFIREVVDSLGFRILRYAVLESTTSNAGMTMFRAAKLQIDSNDIFQLSFSWRTRLGLLPLTTGYIIAYVFLYGIDGTHWALRSLAGGSVPGNPNIWQLVDSNFEQGSGGSPIIGSNEVTDSTQWQSLSVNGTNPVRTPVSGDLEIFFVNIQSTNAVQEYWFKDISITILPYLQGSFIELKGDYNFSGSNNNVKQTVSENVEISDSPKRYFKGAILATDGKTLVPPDWHRRGIVEHFRFTQAMERIMYNLLSRMVYKIEGAFKGLVYLDNDDFTLIKPAGYLNSYFFVDGDFPTKKFMLTSFDIDIYTGQGRRVFVEVLKDANDLGWTSPDNYKFDYIFH